MMKAPDQFRARTITTHKQLLVGLLVGVFAGAVVGFMAGGIALPIGLLLTAATGLPLPNHADAVAEYGWRGSVFMGGGFGIVAGVAVGVPVALFLRIVSTLIRETPLTPRAGVAIGVGIAACIGVCEFFALRPYGLYGFPIAIHATLVGWITGYIAVAANPPWAYDRVS